MITENGCADNNYQKILSIKSMKYFLNGIKFAKEEGVNVIGYHTWTFIDNYEWDDCYIPKFGLYTLSLYQLDKQMKENEKIDKSKHINNYGNFYREIINFNNQYYKNKLL